MARCATVMNCPVYAPNPEARRGTRMRLCLCGCGGESRMDCGGVIFHGIMLSRCDMPERTDGCDTYFFTTIMQIY